MKKNYFMLAAAALMFAACAETDFVNPVPVNEGEAIGFDTYAQLPTRATENNTGTYSDAIIDHHANFAVWAYKNTSNVLVFGTDATTGTAVNAATYDYGDLKYWDKTADNYYFYAAAPVTTVAPQWKLNGVTDIATQANGYFTIEDVLLAATNFRTTPNGTATTTFKSLGDIDYMIAAPCTDKFTTVSLHFIHILSRLNIIAKKATGLTPDPTITLNSVKVYGINLKGSFDESDAVATTAGSIARWTPASTPVTSHQYAYTSDLALSTSGQYVIEGLVIPQEVAYTSTLKSDGTGDKTKPYMEVIYTINGEEFKAYYNLADVFNGNTADNIAFNEGWQNTLTITISPAGIAFEGNVSTWSENPGDQPIM